MDQRIVNRSGLMFPIIISVIIGTFYYLSISKQSFQDIGIKEYSIPLIISMFFGAFFYLTNIRLFISEFSQRRFSQQLKNQIIKLYTKNLTKRQLRYLYSSKTLKEVLYNIINNSESLKNKLINGFFLGPL